MASYIARRLGQAIVTFFGITILVFGLIHAAPGDPTTHLASATGPGGGYSDAALRMIRAEQNLDRPLMAQYLVWSGRLLQFDLGRSYIDRRPISEIIAQKLPGTLILNSIALALALVSGALIAGFAVARPHGLFDRLSSALLAALFALPTFWVALVLIEMFAVRLEWLPMYGSVSDDAKAATGRFSGTYLVLPVLALALAPMAAIAGFTRQALRDAMSHDFIQSARARGVGEMRLITHHAAKNALIPLISLGGVLIPQLVSGSVIVERIFQRDGLGQFFLRSILARDYPAVMALTVLAASVVLLVSVICDCLYHFADPRVRAEELHD